MYNKNGFNLYISVFLFIALLISLLTVYATASAKDRRPSVSARAAALYEPETGTFLFEKDADMRLPMASTTKIMTALVVLENAELGQIVEIDERAVGTEGSSAYLREGDLYTVEELLYALLLGSANDAAVALACNIGGDVSGFADMMNCRAAELSLSDTHFDNPHGLDSEEHFTTARELALIAAEAMKSEEFMTVVSTYKKTFTYGDRTRTYVNHNKLLRLYDDAVGIKTGYTKVSGRCLVGAAERDGLTMITVTLDAPSDWSDHEELFEYGYSTLEKLTLCSAGEFAYRVPIPDGELGSVTVSNPEGLSVIIPRGDHRVEKRISLPRFTAAPVKEGDVLGEIVFSVDGEEVGCVKLTCAESVSEAKARGWFNKLLSYFGLDK